MAGRPRVTYSEVDAIIDEELESYIDLEPFCKAAHNFLDNAFAAYVVTTVNEPTKKELERYLAAHFFTVMRPNITREKIGDLDQTFAGKFGMGLDSSRYGQMAKLLDISGVLSQAGAKMGKLEAI